VNAADRERTRAVRRARFEATHTAEQIRAARMAAWGCAWLIIAAVLVLAGLLVAVLAVELWRVL
jgi:hypothetical protein